MRDQISLHAAILLANHSGPQAVFGYLVHLHACSSVLLGSKSTVRSLNDLKPMLGLEVHGESKTVSY